MPDVRQNDTYERLKSMAVDFRLRPGDRLNEGALARELGISRTPLREALNRLVSENLVTFQPGTGFFCRDLDVQTIFDLFELRSIIEPAAARLACQRAHDTDLATLDDALRSRGMTIDGLTVAAACARDEEFHMQIAQLSGNRSIAAQLQRINESIRFIRWVSMTPEKARKSKAEHRAIMDALLDRDADRAEDLTQAHIEKRRDDVNEAVRQSVANIYTNQSDTLMQQILTEVPA